MLRKFATAFASRFAARSSHAQPDSLQEALIAAGVTLAATRPRRRLGLALLAAGGIVAMRGRSVRRRVG